MTFRSLRLTVWALLAGIMACTSAAHAGKWSGAYFGGSAGGGWGSLRGTILNPTAEQLSNDGGGLHGGGHLGVQSQFGHIVVGAEIELRGGNMSETSPSIIAPGLRYRTDVDWLLTLTGKLGYAWDRWLIYGRAGFASANVKVSGIAGPPTNADFGNTQRHSGFLIGAGIDYKFRPGIIIGLAYDYITLSEESVNATSNNGQPATLGEVGADIHTLTARMSILLGEEQMPTPMQPLK